MMQKKHVTALLICAALGTGPGGLLINSAGAQTEETGIEILTPDHAVLPDVFGHPLAEPHLVAHPQDPGRLLAGAILAPLSERFGPDQNCVILGSADAGATWTLLHEFSQDGSCADPWLAYGKNGETAVFTALWSDEMPAQLIAAVSPDGGQVWNEPHRFFRYADHPTLAVDRTGGAHDGTVYLFSNAQISRALGALNADQYRGPMYGNSIIKIHPQENRAEKPIARVELNLNTSTQPGIVHPDGSVIYGINDYQAFGRTRAENEMLDKRRAWAMRSFDGGESFSPLLFISEECGSAGGFPQMAVDSSDGPHAGRLYWLCGDDPQTPDQLYYSDSRGDRWAPVSVFNTDSPDTQTLEIAVNNRGVVGLAWYDRRNDPAGGCQDIYFTASLDGGQSFLPAVRISEESHCAQNPGNGWVGERWPAGGEYFGLAADAAGRFHILWPDARTGPYRLHTATLGVNGEVISGANE